MSDQHTFERARSDEAKKLREAAILEAARELAHARGVREITLTDIADAVGMHKSTMLRYFETREEIFLRLTEDGWRAWSQAAIAAIEQVQTGDSDAVADALARTLAERGLFCDLLAHAPLNLERRVSVDTVRSFKTVALGAVDAIVAALQRALPALRPAEGTDVIAAVTSLAGVFWQISTPGPNLAELYRTDPRLGHEVTDLEPSLRRVTRYLLRGIAVGAE